MALSSCVPQKRTLVDVGNSSSLSSISMRLPERGAFGEGARLLTGYHVSLVTNSPACEGVASLDETRGYAESALNYQITQGCDYAVLVELGALAEGGARLESVFFSNREALATGPNLKAADFAGKAEVSLPLTLRVTDAGRNLGFAGTTSTQSGDDFDWRALLRMSPVPSAPWSGKSFGSVYAMDVMSHTTDRFLSEFVTTNVHETMHGLASQMRNLTRENDQFVYDENGQGGYVQEPSLSLAKVRGFVPAGARQLAKFSFDLYLVQQVDSGGWDNLLYLLDEWTAYVANARAALEIKSAGQWSGGHRSEIDGSVTFLYFTAAAVQALKTHEPEYLRTNSQFKAAFAMLAEKTAAHAREGLKIAEFNTFQAGPLFEHFRTSPEAASIRATLVEWLGAGYTQRVFGF
jgi:hypothetical protein